MADWIGRNTAYPRKAWANIKDGDSVHGCQTADGRTPMR